MKKVIVVVGPTAVGKSDFAIELAKRLDGEIISGDSIQVYQGLDIGSGKVTKQEMAEVKHHLIDIYTTDMKYSVADFQIKAREIIDHSDKPMIICGGTGLYIKACLYDYVFSDQDGAGIDTSLEKYTNEELYAQLLEIDPKQAEKIHPNNRQRMLRTLTIASRNSIVQSEVIASQDHQMIYDACIVGCTMERSALYKRINARVEKMFEDGLQHEVEQLLGKGVHFDDACMKGIGYREWKSFFDGEQTVQQVKEEIQKHSRQFAKRQYTWFNHQMDVEWFENQNPLEREQMLEKLVTWYQGN
ncbi:MAG: tRNA (adenosine(37)-N6)-dimethylallyltransferase MiaA [Erysipelotrichaceae bacterium]|nr:tRNA (adenosine(37)-N6)-dimethylallyltransferase MiaA [Erysipelotrichaceae bacterium]